MAFINDNPSILGIGRFRLKVGATLPDTKFTEHELKQIALFKSKGFLVEKVEEVEEVKVEEVEEVKEIPEVEEVKEVPVKKKRRKRSKTIDSV